MIRVRLLVFLSAVTICSVVSSAVVPKPGVINKSNFPNFGYEIKLDLPRPDEPDLKRFNIKFPKSLDNGFEYAYSKALYSENDKYLLSYRPSDISFGSSTKAEFYILADKSIIKCLSLVNIYFKSGGDDLHPPSIAVQVDLSSFIGADKKCERGLNANDSW